MISSLAWIPKGIANPRPQKYELSATERELLESLPPVDEDDDAWKRRLQTRLPKPQPTTAPQRAENDLPADLRMDEYSSDDDDDSMTNAAAMGRLLVGHDEAMEPAEEDDGEGEEGFEDDDDDEEKITPEQEEHDQDSDDDLDDVPDTREFEPINLAGMQAMGISHVHGGGVQGAAFLDDQNEDDNSEAEDVALTPDDALIVVAKTEDVRSLSVVPLIVQFLFSSEYFLLRTLPR
jgi:nitrogen regulatory protein PII